MLNLLLAAAVACPRAVAINSKGAPSYEAKMNLFAKNNRGESCASDEGLSDLSVKRAPPLSRVGSSLVSTWRQGRGPGLGLEVVQEPSLNCGCCIQRAPSVFLYSASV